MGGSRVVYCLIPLFAAACGGSKKPAAKPVPKETVTAPVAPPETEADREAKRHAAALAIVPEGSKCLPTSLKDEGAPRLDLAAVNGDAVVCAIDNDKSRLLGPIACWKVDVSSGALTYQDAAPLPGHDIDVLLEDRCAHGFCLPKDAKIAGIKVAHLAWNLDGSKVAVLVGDDVHIFDGGTKEHLSMFSVRGDKGVSNEPTAVYFVSDTVFVEGADQGPYSAVWAFKTDGSQMGPIAALGGKDDKAISTFHGSVSVLDKNRIAIAERGFETLTTYEIETGKRTKLVRKLGKPACKVDELDAFWHDGDKVTDKCKDSMMKMSGHLIGATAVAGKNNFLVLLRNDRLGELAVLDFKSLAEKKEKLIKLPWCGAASAAATDDAGAPPSKADAPAKSERRSAAKPATAPKRAKTGDPDEGGE